MYSQIYSPVSAWRIYDDTYGFFGSVNPKSHMASTTIDPNSFYGSDGQFSDYDRLAGKDIFYHRRAPSIAFNPRKLVSERAKRTMGGTILIG